MKKKDDDLAPFTHDMIYELYGITEQLLGKIVQLEKDVKRIIEHFGITEK